MKSKAGSYPYLIWMLLFIIIPLGLILYYSFTTNVDGKTVFTLSNFARSFEPIFIRVMLRSMRLALISTLICLGLGYPAALIMTEKNFDQKGTILFLIIMPMWMNFLLRTYAWLTILERNGLLNTVLEFFNLPAVNILYTESAVTLGMVYNFIPFMILPIYTVLKKMDQSVIEAAQDLGANSFNVFFRVILPLSLPGVISGITMVFMPAVTTFIISNLLGGMQFILIGNLIEQQFLTVYDWHFGSAISVILMVIILFSMAVIAMVDREPEGVVI